MRFCSLLILFTLLCSCGGTDPEIPSNVLSKEEMVVIITDLQLSEANTSLGANSGMRLNDFSRWQKLRILKTRNVPEGIFDSSWVFYTRNPKLMIGIYDEVIDTLSKLQIHQADQ